MDRHTILVADDDRDLLMALTIRLRAAGYDVVGAVDGYQAVHFTQEKQPDLILLDVHMPAGDGFSVQERIQKHCDGHATPIIYLTGDKSMEATRHAKELGAYAVIHKPYDEVDLLVRIEDALSSVDAGATP